MKRLLAAVAGAFAVLAVASTPAYASGAFAETLNWGTIAGASSYDTYVNGTEVATASSGRYTFGGLNCGTTYTLGVAPHGASPIGLTYTTPTCPLDPHAVFPLQVSGNSRYLEEQNGSPFLVVGDSPQSPIGNLSTTGMATYLADRESHGFNAVWANLLCNDYTDCNANGTTASGTEIGSVAPFTSGSNPATYSFGTGLCGDCNATYFTHAHTMVAQAQTDGIEVFLDPIETGNCLTTGWMQTMINNGDGTLSTTDADYKYGEFLGNEFKDLKNIVWQSGNDFNCISTAADDNDARSVANGIAATDPSALQTLEADDCNGWGCPGSTSIVDTAGDPTNWSSQIQVNSVYTYAPTYALVRTAFGESPTMPAIMGEASYEGQQNSSTDGCGAGPAGDTTARLCRLQDWWTMTSGATGQLYGGPCYGISGTTNVAADCDTAGASQLKAQATFLRTLSWWTLKPDTAGAVVTSGGGSCPAPLAAGGGSSGGAFGALTCVTTASDYSGSAGSATESVSYLPDPTTAASPVVNMADFSGPVTANWVDPASGAETAATGTQPFTNSGSKTFTPSGNNSVGDKDWVLFLKVSPPAAPTNTSAPTISGTDTQGDVLTASNGTWTGSPTFTYQWQDCNSSGTSCSNISGATSSTYTLQAGDVGDTIVVVVTGTNGGGNATAASSATSVVGSSGGFTVSCALTYAAGAGNDSKTANWAEDGTGAGSTCWGQQTGVYAGTGDTEAAIEANPTSLGFTHVTSDVTLSTNGQTLNKEWIDGGCINVRANNVTIENVLITDSGPDCSGGSTAATAIDVDQDPAPTGTLIENVTVDGTDNGAESNNKDPAVTINDGEVLRVNLFGWAQGYISDTNDQTHAGLPAGGGSLIQDSYGHDYTSCEHDDGTWFDTGVYVNMQHDWIETNDPTSVDATGCATGACVGGSDFGPEHDITVNASFCDGGSDSPNDGDGENYHSGCGGTDMVVTNDVFDATAGKTNSYGAWNPSDTGNVWTNNKFIDHSGTLTTANPQTAANAGC